MKRSEAAELVMMLMGAFPSGKTNESTSRLYEEMLADLDVTRARRAVTKLIRTAKFLPSISEIREEAGAVPLAAPYHREWKPVPSVPQERRLPPGPFPGKGPDGKRVLGPVTEPQSASDVSAGAALWNYVPAVQQTKGAAADAQPSRQEDAVVAPADIPMMRQPAKPPPVVHRRWSAEELEAAMGEKGRGDVR